MRQDTLATAGSGRYGRPARRAALLVEMDRVVPWHELCALIEPVYPTPARGRRPVDLERMLCIYILPQWPDLSDPGGKRHRMIPS